MRWNVLKSEGLIKCSLSIGDFSIPDSHSLPDRCQRRERCSSCKKINISRNQGDQPGVILKTCPVAKKSINWNLKMRQQAEE